MGLRLLEPGQDDQLRGALAHHAADASGDLGDHEEALRLALLSAEAHHAAGTLGGAAESLRLAALAAEQLGRPDQAADLWHRAAGDAQTSGRSDLEVLALRCRPLPLAVAGRYDDALEALALADERVTGAGLDEDHTRWERASLDLQRLRVAVAADRPSEGLDAGARAIPEFEALGDLDSADNARVSLSRALRLDDDPRRAQEVLSTGADAALARDDAEAARNLGGELASDLDADGQPAEAERVWRRYSGEG